MKHLFFLLVFLAGIASATGFAPLGLWPLTLAGIAVLITMTLNVTRMRTAFATGWAFGLGHFGLSLNWIATAFSFQSAMPAWLGWIAVAIVAVYLSCFIGLASALAWRFGKNMPLVFVLLFAGFWIVTEYLSAIAGFRFLWNPLAAITVSNMHTSAWAAGSTQWIGTYSLSGLIVLLAGSLYMISRGLWRVAIGVSLFPVLLIMAGALNSIQIDVTRPNDYVPPPAIRIIQPNIDQSQKWDSDFDARNFALLERYTGETGDRPRLIFWPEAAVPAYLEDDPLAQFRIASLIGPDDILMLGATKLNWETGEDGRQRVEDAYNSFYAMNADREFIGRYDKTHLVPYGEYLPMRGLMEAVGMSRLAPGNIDFIPGPGPTTIDLPGFGAMGGQICYELVFSGQVIDRDERPDFIFNPSNDAWFGRWGPPQHLAQARLRAIEEAMPIVRSTPTGISAVIDAQGQVTHSIPWREAGTIDARLPRAGGPTLFSRHGNILPMGLAVLLVLFAFALRRRAR